MFFGVAVVVVPYSFLSFIYFYVGDASSMGEKPFGFWDVFQKFLKYLAEFPPLSHRALVSHT